MLGVTGVMWEECRDVEHDLPILVRGVYGLLPCLIIVHVQPPAIPEGRDMIYDGCAV